MRPIAWLSALAAAFAGLLWVVLDGPPAPPSHGPRAERSAPATAHAVVASRPAGSAPFSASGLQAREAERALWQQRLERAQGALEAYRESTRYPHGSQPIAAHPDQAYPNEPISEEHPLAKPGDKDNDGATLHTTQERVFVQGSESARFTISLRDREGKTLPLRIVRASAREMPPPNTGSLFAELPMAFNDEGGSGDRIAGDGIFSVQLQPESQGFAGLFGQIRVEAMLQYRDQQGRTYFDIFYTPEAPATWQGGVREAIEDGSLNFYLKANVRKPGRYVVSARVDDASGTPFALLNFNDEVAQGTQEIRLTVFGKLLRDAKPAFPLTLRDVDGFLLHPDTFPDRSLMPRRQGKVHVSQDHPLASFAGAEWVSEARTRYLDELGRDVAEARVQVERLSKGQ